MKNNHIHISLFLSSLFLLSVLLATVAAASNNIANASPLQTFMEIPGYSQLTDEELASPTEELAWQVVQNRYTSEWGISNRGLAAFYRHLKYMFNGISELESRKDAASALLTLYNQAIQTENAWLLPQTCLFLLSRPVFNAQLTETERLSILEEMTAYLSAFDTVSVSELNGTPFSLSLTQSSSSYSITTLKTACGLSVSAYIIEDTLTDDEREIMSQEYKLSFPAATLLAPPNLKYNCHSYAWHDSSTSNTYWIDHPRVYIADPHAFEISSNQVTPGTIVVYYDSYGEEAHSAVVTSISNGNIICVSKWGQYGLYQHEISYVPSDYKNNGNVTPRYFNYVRSSHQLNYTYTSSTHTGKCTICNYSTTSSHLTRVVSTTAASHTMGCRVCSYTKTEEHTVDPNKNICTICKRSGPFSSIINNLLPEIDDAANHTHHLNCIEDSYSLWLTFLPPA